MLAITILRDGQYLELFQGAVKRMKFIFVKHVFRSKFFSW